MWFVAAPSSKLIAILACTGGLVAASAALAQSLLSFQASPLGPLRANPSFVSPAQICALQPAHGSWEFATEMSHSSIKHISVPDHSTPGIAKSYGSRAALAYGWQSTPSLYASAHTHYSRDTTKIFTANAEARDQRLLMAGGIDGAFKVMDKLVLGLSLENRAARAQIGDRNFSQRHSIYHPAFLLKSEWYEVGLSQRLLHTAPLLEASAKANLYREHIAHAAVYFSSHPTSGAAFGTILKQNPLPDCCRVSASNRRSYGLTIAAWLQDLAASLAVTYLTHGSAFIEPAYRQVNDPDRYQINGLFRYRLLALTAAYEATNKSHVNASGWRLGLAVQGNL